MSAKRLTKAQVIAEIAESAELDKKSVSRVFDGLTELIKKELRKPNGEFVIPGPAQAARHQEAGHEGPPGHQPVHQAAHHHQGQAGSEEGPRDGAQGAEGSHSVSRFGLTTGADGRPAATSGAAPVVHFSVAAQHARRPRWPGRAGERPRRVPEARIKRRCAVEQRRLGHEDGGKLRLATRARTRPAASTHDVGPKLTARTRSRRSSTARRVATRRWSSLSELPKNHASLVTLTSRFGATSCLAPRLRQHVLVADEDRGAHRARRRARRCDPRRQAPDPARRRWRSHGTRSASGTVSPNHSRCRLS